MEDRVAQRALDALETYLGTDTESTPAVRAAFLHGIAVGLALAREAEERLRLGA